MWCSGKEECESELRRIEEIDQVLWTIGREESNNQCGLGNLEQTN